jgi:hypothetical protein
VTRPQAGVAHHLWVVDEVEILAGASTYLRHLKRALMCSFRALEWTWLLLCDGDNDGGDGDNSRKRDSDCMGESDGNSEVERVAARSWRMVDKGGCQIWRKAGPPHIQVQLHCHWHLWLQDLFFGNLLRMVFLRRQHSEGERKTDFETTLYSEMKMSGRKMLAREGSGSRVSDQSLRRPEIS